MPLLDGWLGAAYLVRWRLWLRPQCGLSGGRRPMTMGCAATFRAKPAAQTMVTTRTQRSWYFSAPKILSCRDACGGSAPRTRRYAAVACRSGSWWACRPARRCTNSLISSRTVVPHQIVVPDTPPEGTEVPRSDRYSSWACRADLAAEAGDLGERKARRRPAPLIVALCRWCGAGLLPVGWLGLRIYAAALGSRGRSPIICVWCPTSRELRSTARAAS
jgi:hypothetical protein